MNNRAATMVCIAWALTGCQAVTKLGDLEFSEDVQIDWVMRDAAPLPASDASADGSSQLHDGGPGGNAMDATNEDTRCRIAEGADCDLARQCGCDPSQHCQARGRMNRPMCVAPGDKPPWSGCGRPEECPTGQTCDRGSCRDYCAQDADCEGGVCLPTAGPDAEASTGINVCWKTCSLEEEGVCAEGTKCRSVKTPFADAGTFCVAPFDPCPTAEDGTCDEEKGTGTCASGTDTKDCECAPKLPAAKCDPVEQCGCAADSTCEFLTISSDPMTGTVPSLTAKCAKAGTQREHQPCANTIDCGLGLFCQLSSGTCERTCKSDADCEDGACFKLINPDEPNLGICIRKCDRVTDKPCTGNEVCASLRFEAALDVPGDYCWLPSPTCVTNGMCDEPEGTNICLEGTDSADCCKPAVAGGVCDPVAQCGCAPGMQCQHVMETPVTACTPLPVDPQPAEGLCSDYRTERACEPGYTCYLGACREYCSRSQDCGGGANLCLQLRDESNEPVPLGRCMRACDFEANDCAEGLVCGILGGIAYCMRQADQCPFVGDGKCDDPRPGGTRVCAMGSDPDCE